MLNNITGREKILAIITIGAVFAALVYNFLIEPLVGRWNTLEKEILDKESLFRKHSRIIRKKEIIEKLHSEYNTYFETEELTPEEESAVVLSSIEKLARNAGVRLTNIKPLTVKDFENYKKYTFRVATESQIGQLSRFIYDLQSSNQLLKIERMVLRAKERAPNTIKAILHITKVAVF